MTARIFTIRREGQVNLDDVFPVLRNRYSEEQVYVEADLFDALKEAYGSDLESEMGDILKYFFEEKGALRALEGDSLRQGERLEFFLDDNLDEHEQRYHMILLKKPRD